MGALESDCVKSARKAQDKLHKACERALETRDQTLHGQEQNRMRRGLGTSVPFILHLQVTLLSETAAILLVITMGNFLCLLVFCSTVTLHLQW